MNGVFVNKSKIPAGELIRLKLGDELGVGAMDAAIENYFIFDVCKMLIKDETQVYNINHLKKIKITRLHFV